MNGKNYWSGQKLTASGPGGVQEIFTFPFNLLSAATAGKRALVATQGFASRGLVTPDFVVPNGFL